MPAIISSDIAASETPVVTLDDQDGNPVTLHESTRRALNHIDGLIGVGPLRDDRRVRPQAHGGLDSTRFEDGRLINLEGAVWGDAGNQVIAWAEFRAICKPMLETLDVGPALLKWTEAGSGLALQREVRLAGEVNPPLEESMAVLNYQAQFYAEDPRAYSQVQATDTSTGLSAAAGGAVMPATMSVLFSQSGGGFATVTNAGNRPTPLVFRVYGRIVNPQIVLVGSGLKIALIGTVPAGSYLELDTQARTVKMNGTTAQLSFLDSANTTWMEAPAGASTWQMIAADFDGTARLDILSRSAYA